MPVIKVPRPPKNAMDSNRPINALLLARFRICSMQRTASASLSTAFIPMP